MPPKGTTHILKSLRQLMKDAKLVPQAVQAYIIPSGDAHQNEYISPCDCHREYISGFSGSAGTAVVTQSHAALWVDGRYHVQADAQTDDNWLVMKEGLKDTPSIPEWLSKTLDERNAQIGVDPNIMPSVTWESMTTQLEVYGFDLTPVPANLVDKIWTDRPQRPNNPLMILSTKYCGVSWQEKVSLLREEMEKNKAEVCVLTALDDIAWLLNLRGSDIPLNPVFYSYVIVSMSEVRFFVDESKMTSDVRKHLGENSEGAVKLHPYYEFDGFFSSLAGSISGKLWLSKTSSHKLHAGIAKEKRYLTENSHVYVMKAVKNDTEIEGMRNAHYKDAVTLCEFFSWLEKEIKHNEVTESDAAAKLERIKSEQEDYISLSFDTISSTGPNAAINHYKPIPGEDRVIDNAGIYLLDSGAQYRDGTTDVTRTIHFGTPTTYERECYTRVLKGHIQLATTIWPRGVKGSSLDSFARMHLWNAGLDYKHGTGHGVGAFLNVHEALFMHTYHFGQRFWFAFPFLIRPWIIVVLTINLVSLTPGPCAIGIRSKPGEVALEPGMIITDEPGYYEDGKFGIRIENCMLITEATRPMEPITLVPISAKMIEPSLLTESEIDWLNRYHVKCRDVIAPLLKEAGKCQALDWLLRETAPIG